MSVVHLRDFKEWRGTPTLVLMDLHRNRLDAANDGQDESVSSALANCRIALHHARASGMPVAFARLVDEPSGFGESAGLPIWLDGFEPMRSEMIFDRQKPSCYASQDFSDMADYVGGHCVLAGLYGESSCLATLIEAHHRNHRFAFLADASASRTPQGVSSGAVHETLTGIVSLYAKIECTRSWMQHTRRTIEAVS